MGAVARPDHPSVSRSHGIAGKLLAVALFALAVGGRGRACASESRLAQGEVVGRSLGRPRIRHSPRRAVSFGGVVEQDTSPLVSPCHPLAEGRSMAAPYTPMRDGRPREPLVAPGADV